MLGMHSVLAEPQRELIIANARDGLAARAADGLVGTASQRSTPDPCTTTAQTPGRPPPGGHQVPAAVDATRPEEDSGGGA